MCILWSKTVWISFLSLTTETGFHDPLNSWNNMKTNGKSHLWRRPLWEEADYTWGIACENWGKKQKALYITKHLILAAKVPGDLLSSALAACQQRSMTLVKLCNCTHLLDARSCWRLVNAAKLFRTVLKLASTFKSRAKHKTSFRFCFIHHSSPCTE